MSGTSSTYLYDGDGKRASKTVGGTPTNYTYDVNASLPVLLDDGTRKYVWGLGLAFAADASGSPIVYHTDGLGSVRALTDVSGTVVQTYLYDEYGSVTSTVGSITQPFQYTGEVRDAETGFMYLRARYYQPESGRFLRKDSLAGVVEAPQTLNHYTYADNNSTLLLDPSGKCAVVAAACPSLDQCIKDCALDELGVQDLAAALGVAAGQPLMPTRAKPQGATPGT